jgi:hypothetical protein
MSWISAFSSQFVTYWYRWYNINDIRCSYIQYIKNMKTSQKPLLIYKVLSYYYFERGLKIQYWMVTAICCTDIYLFFKKKVNYRFCYFFLFLIFLIFYRCTWNMQQESKWTSPPDTPRNYMSLQSSYPYGSNEYSTNQSTNSTVLPGMSIQPTMPG